MFSVGAKNTRQVLCLSGVSAASARWMSAMKPSAGNGCRHHAHRGHAGVMHAADAHAHDQRGNVQVKAEGGRQPERQHADKSAWATRPLPSPMPRPASTNRWRGPWPWQCVQRGEVTTDKHGPTLDRLAEKARARWKSRGL